MSEITQKLDYHLRTLRVLREAGYRKGTFPVLDAKETMAMTVAYDEGMLPENFARLVLEQAFGICHTCDERPATSDAMRCKECQQKRDDDGPSDSELAAYADSCYPTSDERHAAAWRMKG